MITSFNLFVMGPRFSGYFFTMVKKVCDPQGTRNKGFLLKIFSKDALAFPH
jgi:hypothetical protein